MNASGDIGDFSEFTISSVNDDEVTDERSSPITDNELSVIHESHNKTKSDNIHLMRIELSRKTMELEKCRKDFFQREEELQDRLDVLLHQRDTIQYQLEAEIKSNHEESIKRQQNFQKKLEKAESHQKYLENTNSKLVQSTIELKSALAGDLQINEEIYENLKLKSEFELSVRELIQLKIHEIVRPLVQESRTLKVLNVDLNCEKNELNLELEAVKLSLNEERKSHRELQEEFKNNLMELSKTKDKVKMGNYKVENFDRILKQHDSVSELYSSLKHEYEKMKLTCSSIESERDNLMKTNLDSKQSLRMLDLDKEYLSKQVNELSMRYNNAEERLQTAWKQLEDCKISREQLYDKYVGSREEFRTQYEQKLRDELDNLKWKTEQEIEKIKIGTRELYDREIRGLQESKELTEKDREIGSRRIKELEEIVERFKTDSSLNRSVLENQVSELMNEVKMKSFELERTSILYDECCQKLSNSNLDVEKYQAKFDLLTKEYYQLECRSSRDIHELKTQLEESQKKMVSYERLEKELDLAVMHAAENYQHANDVEGSLSRLNSMGVVMPTESGRRMQQSIELARRVLHLERMLKERTETVEKLRGQIENLSSELERNEKLLSDASQPYEYLISNLRQRDQELTNKQLQMKDLTDQLNVSRKEKNRLATEKNQLLQDVETLLNQSEELSQVRKTVQQMSSNPNGELNSKISRESRYDSPINMKQAGDKQLKSTVFYKSDIKKFPEYSISRS